MYWTDGQVALHQGDVREVLREMSAESVQCVVTSPPYWGLRDYGTATWDGGDAACVHKPRAASRASRPKGSLVGSTATVDASTIQRDCHCGARRIDRQLGLEPTPEGYVTAMVDVFREVRRVLRDDGTLWLNIGDTYAAQRGGSSMPAETLAGGVSGHGDKVAKRGRESEYLAHRNAASYGLKHKDLVGIPWMLAFALRADGWWLRQDIIWSKPNPMPESVRDRCTKAHEMVFLLTKSSRYYFDSDAIREGVGETGIVESPNRPSDGLVLFENLGTKAAAANHAFRTPLVPSENGRGLLLESVRKATAILDLAQGQSQFGLLSLDSQVGQQFTNGSAGLSVVEVPVVRRAAAQAARFANGDVSAKEFLSEVDRLCVALPDGDDLKETWRRAALVNTDGDASVTVNDAGEVSQFEFGHAPKDTISGVGSYSGRNKRSVWHIATAPFPEAHFATFPPALVEPCILAGSREGDVVLDPFIGSGTTAMVARQLGRRAIGIDLNTEYLAMARRRVGEQLALLGDAR